MNYTLLKNHVHTFNPGLSRGFKIDPKLPIFDPELTKLILVNSKLPVYTGLARAVLYFETFDLFRKKWFKSFFSRPVFTENRADLSLNCPVSLKFK